MKSRWVASLFLTAAIGAVAWLHVSESRAAPNTVVSLCYEDADARPWRYRRGGGLDFQLLERAGRSAGVAFRYEALSRDDCQARLRAGAVDGAFGAEFNVSPDSSGSEVGYAKVLHTERHVLLRRKGDAPDWNGKTRRAAGSAADHAPPRPSELLHRLARGEVSAASLPSGEAEFALKANPELATQLEILPAPLAETSAYLLFSNRFVQARPELADRVAGAIETASASAAYRMLVRQMLAAFDPA